MVTGQIKSIISVLFCCYLTCATSCISLIVSLKDVTQLVILLFKSIIQEMFLIFDIVEFIEWSVRLSRSSLATKGRSEGYSLSHFFFKVFLVFFTKIVPVTAIKSCAKNMGWSTFNDGLNC